MILNKNFYNKHEVNYFMKYLIFLSMIITSSKAAKSHSFQKSNHNETLSDLDFEDSINPILLAEQNYSVPNLLEKSDLIENEVKFQSSTEYSLNGLKKTKKSLQSKKHRNIIKMVCDSDNLISQMTLHMNFLDNSKDDKHHDFIYKKVFNTDEPKNEVLFSYPEVPETLNENESDETDENLVKDIELSVSKPYNENGSFKKDNNINYLLLNEEYETYPLPKKKKTKPELYSKDDYKLEVKKFNSGPSVESLKMLRENYAPNKIKQKKRNKLKFWVTAVSFTETSEEVEKNDVLHKLHLSEKSDHSDPFSSNTPEVEEVNSDPGLENNDIFIPQVIDNIEQAHNNTQDDQDINFSDREDDGENKNNEEVLNYSKKFKKYKLANSKHTIDENENINQPDETFLYDYPHSYKKQYRNEILSKHNNKSDKGKQKKKYKASKNNLIARPKMKSIVSSNRAQIFGGKSLAAIVDKKKKTLQRQKVIENLKFILSKQGNDNPKPKSDILPSKSSSVEKTKDMSNISKTPGKKNSTKVVDISDNRTNGICKDDTESESSSAMEEILFAYENQNIPFDIYDIDINNNDVKTKLSNKDLFYQANNEKNKKKVNRKDLHSKFGIPSKKENRITNEKDIGNQISQDSSQPQKYNVKRMAEDKGEEIRKGVFLKKGIPLQFNPHQKINYLDNKNLLGFQTMSPVGGSQRKLTNGNEKQYSNAKTSYNSKEQKNSENLKIQIKRNSIMENTYQKACHRFLRDIALIKFLNDNSESMFFSN